MRWRGREGGWGRGGRVGQRASFSKETSAVLMQEIMSFYPFHKHSLPGSFILSVWHIFLFGFK